MKSQRPPVMIVDDMEGDSTHMTIEKINKYGVQVVVDHEMQNDEWKLVQGQFHGQPSKSEYEIFKTIENMEAYGGSFVKRLAELARHADPINLKKIQSTWPEYWEKYSRDF